MDLTPAQPEGDTNISIARKRDAVMIEHTIPNNVRVVERATLEAGIVRRRGWWVDLNNDVPAIPYYVVAFDDGREKQCREEEIEERRPPMYTCPGCGRDTPVVFNQSNCPVCIGRE